MKRRVRGEEGGGEDKRMGGGGGGARVYDTALSCWMGFRVDVCPHFPLAQCLVCLIAGYALVPPASPARFSF